MAVSPVATAAGGFRPVPWNVAALVLAGLGVVAATSIIVASDGDSSQVRWLLVIAPVAVCLVPVLVPRQGARTGAVVALVGWCMLTTLSIGFLLWPALAASLMASSGRRGEP
jgi:hypothetical protein